MNKPWTPEDDARLEALLKITPRLKYIEIAKIIGRSRNSCIGRSHRLGIYLYHGFRTSDSGVPVKWTPEKDAELRSLIEVDGKSYKHAGLILGVTEAQAQGRARRQGIRSSNGKGPKPSSGGWKALKLARTGSTAPKTAPTVDPEPIEASDYPLILGLPAALMQRGARQCEFPLGEPTSPNFSYCRATKLEHDVYCSAHRKIASAPVQSRLR